MAQLGFRTFDEMIGRSECLEMRKAHRPLEGARARPVGRSSISPRSAPERRALLHDGAEPRPRDGARRHHPDPPVQAGAGARRAGRGRRCRSATSTAPSAPASAARSRASTAPSGLPEDTIQLHFNGSAGQSFMAFVPHGRDLRPSKATPTTTSARASRAARSSSARPRSATFTAEENVIIGNVALLRRDRRRGVHPRHGRRALLRPQQRRARGRRGGGRPRLRVHDRRPGGGAGADRAQLRRRACRAASPTSSTRTGSSSGSCNKEMVRLCAARGCRGGRGGAGR